MGAIGRKIGIGWQRVAACAFLVVCAACDGKPPDDSKDYPARSRPIAREGRRVSEGPRADPGQSQGRVAAARLLPIDPGYKVAAVLKPSNDQTIIPMPTSTGVQRQMRPAGALEIHTEGQPLKLTAFHDLSDRNPDSLSVMFTDLTSGGETYPGGRYLDLDRKCHRHLRSRFQPCVPAVLLLQPDLRVPAAAPRKPAHHSHSGRRTYQE